MSRIARRPVALFSFAVMLLAVPLWWFPRPSLSPLPAPGPAPSHAANLEVVAIRAGLDANALAASGVSGSAATTLVQTTNQYLLEHSLELAAADEAFVNARREVDRLQDLIQTGHGSEQDLVSLQAQEAALAAAGSQRETVMAAVYSTSVVGLPNEQQAVLTKIRANRRWSLPLEFLVVERTEAEWVRVRDCLAHERIATGKGMPVDPTVEAQLAAWRAEPTVALAAVNLSTNFSTVAAAWNAAMPE